MFAWIKKIFNKNNSNEPKHNDYSDIKRLVDEFAVSSLFGQSRRVNSIIIHCSGSKTDEVKNAQDINIFFKLKGYKENFYTGNNIPYHFVVLSDGSIINTNSLNVPSLNSPGANSESISICYIGGIGENNEHKDTRTLEQKYAMDWLIDILSNTLSIRLVYGHSNIKDKRVNDLCIEECPCFDAYNEYKKYF